MLKKVMIICIAFSFVFIGGIAFAAGEKPEPPQEGQNIDSESAIPGDTTSPAEATDLITDESKTIIEEGFELKEKVEEIIELKEKVLEEDDKGQN